MYSASAKPHLIIIGNGMAGTRLLEEMLADEGHNYRISIFGAEPQLAYNRILLSPVLAGEMPRTDIQLHNKDWYRQHRIHLYTDDPVIHVDTENGYISSASGVRLAYDKLVFATGASSFIPEPLQHIQHENIHQFRTLNDVTQILNSSRNAHRAVVLGGGLLGLEAAHGLQKAGLQTDVVHRGQYLMNRQLDMPAATLLENTLINRGISVHTGCEPENITVNTDKAISLRLNNGRQLQTDMLVIAAGIRPNTQLANSSGLHCQQGIRINDRLQTSVDNIYALGECCQLGDHTFGLVAPIWEQANVLAAQLKGRYQQRYQPRPSATQLKVAGIDLFSAGNISDQLPATDTLVLKDPGKDTYKNSSLPATA
ncbi:FAD-dependent oxidoreductase [Aliamphritea spongicola]|nr:FAD-dependent oxidoreductase [Aliamphritea spongicola]